MSGGGNIERTGDSIPLLNRTPAPIDRGQEAVLDLILHVSTTLRESFSK